MPAMTENTGFFPPQYEPQHEAPARPSAADAARDQAATVGRSAAEAGGQVTQTAADQARTVAAETARQARDLLGEAGEQVRGQASAQQGNAARQLHAVAGELREMADKGGRSGLATEVAQQAAERLHGTASWLEQREPADLVQAVRDFARRRPGTFLLGAAVAGLVAGRLTRGMTDAARSAGQDGHRQDGTGQRPSRPIPSAAIAPPPDPDWTTPMPEYPADTIPGGTSAGTVTPGTEPYYPAAGVTGPGAAGSAADDVGAARRGYEDLSDTDPATYRPGQLP